LFNAFHRQEGVSKAEAEMVLPMRTLVTGPCGSGKSTLAVFLVLLMESNFDRFIFVCPSYYDQELFRLVDHLVIRKKDIYHEPTNSTFDEIKEDILIVNAHCKKEGKPKVRTLIMVDDLAGLHVLHGGRFGSFPNFCVSARHSGTSLIVISQQPTSVTPAFRDNANCIIAFPSNRDLDIRWLIKEYKMPNMDAQRMKTLILRAWRGVDDDGAEDDENNFGKHFLFIIYDPRTYTKYYSDFDYSVTPKTLKH
jgi:energy-coupling factor transporter ATP-binding protein EcfA2